MSDVLLRLAHEESERRGARIRELEARCAAMVSALILVSHADTFEDARDWASEVWSKHVDLAPWKRLVEAVHALHAAQARLEAADRPEGTELSATESWNWFEAKREVSRTKDALVAVACGLREGR